MITREENRNCYSVPEGYFEDLQKRLSAIATPEIDEIEAVAEEIPVSSWGKLKPYFALAAIFVFGLVAGTFFLNRTVGMNPNEDLVYEQFYCADMLPVTYDLYSIGELMSYDEPEFPTDEEVIEFMIESGASLEMLVNYNE
ncbi:MAG: hypothetical protein MJZ16_02695 [Bacteroidales bacterium]|nr:hypothetical protein [Bacteroidales bacterium]